MLAHETENTIIDGILELLNTHGLPSHQSMNLLHFHGHSHKGNPEAKTGGIRFRSSSNLSILLSNWSLLPVPSIDRDSIVRPPDSRDRGG
jgi:hypothetical protein